MDLFEVEVIHENKTRRCDDVDSSLVLRCANCSIAGRRMDKAGVEKPRASSKITPPEVTARINPTVRNRLLVVLSFPLIILLAVPFWWYTTSIERLPLPAARIHALENSTVGLPPDIN